MESMILAKAPSKGEKEPEPAAFCDQTMPETEGLGHQLSHKTSDLQFVLSAECSGTGA